MKQGEMKAYYLFSPWLRIFHWVMVVCILVLFATGLYIGDPFYIGTQGTEPTFAVNNVFSMETVRFIHFIAAYILTASLILKIYGFLINRGDRLFPNPMNVKYWTGIIDTKLHYMFMRPKHLPYLRNSLARSGYATVYLLIIIEIITGFAMYFMVDPNSFLGKISGPVISLLGGEYMVHIIHHLIAWFIILFAIVHVYMAIRADYIEKGGEVSSMFSGIKYMEETPDDIEDLVGPSYRRKGLAKK